MSHILIRGDGVAGRCCAHLLSRAGVTVSVESASRARLPAILLGETAQRLIGDVFGLQRAFENLPRIRRRIVAWGPKAEPAVMDHSAVVVSEEALLEWFGPVPVAGDRGSTLWTIHATKPLPMGATERSFGSRVAAAAPVELEPSAEAEACWIESLPDGWLFLVTVSPRAGWLLVAGGPPEDLLKQSRVVSARIATMSSSAATFPASPRMAAPIAGNGWLACGTAAMAFDPICGEGTAHAVREAILASAAIKAAMRGEDVARLIQHYDNRLTAAFLRHLVHCVGYYAAVRGDWWEKAAAAAKEGIEWCSGRLGGDPKFHYRLNRLELEAID